MTNLKKLAIDATAKMPVTDVHGIEQFNDAGEAMTITFYGPGTKQFQQAKHNFEKKTSTSSMAALMGKDDKTTATTSNTNLAEFLADVTVSFDGFNYEGRPAGKETYAAAFSDLEIGHVAEAANVFLGKRGNFKKVAPTTSPDTSAILPG